MEKLPQRNDRFLANRCLPHSTECFQLTDVCIKSFDKDWIWLSVDMCKCICVSVYVSVCESVVNLPFEIWYAVLPFILDERSMVYTYDWAQLFPSIIIRRKTTWCRFLRNLNSIIPTIDRMHADNWIHIRISIIMACSLSGDVKCKILNKQKKKKISPHERKIDDWCQHSDRMRYNGALHGNEITTLQNYKKTKK